MIVIYDTKFEAKSLECWAGKRGNLEDLILQVALREADELVVFLVEDARQDGTSRISKIEVGAEFGRS